MTKRRRNFHNVVNEGSGEKIESRISLVAKIFFISMDRMAPLELRCNKFFITFSDSHSSATYFKRFKRISETNTAMWNLCA
jgi:hypothetical protein